MAWPKGTPRPPDTRARIAAANVEVWKDPARRAIAIKALADPEVRQRMSMAKKQLWAKLDLQEAEIKALQASVIPLQTENDQLRAALAEVALIADECRLNGEPEMYDNAICRDVAKQLFAILARFRYPSTPHHTTRNYYG
jgi:hypothetical protein